MEFREKRKFFSLRPPARNRREISGWVQWVKWCPHIGQQMHCWQSVAAGPFWPCFACPKLGDAGRTRVASKNREYFFIYIKKSSQEDFALKSNLWPPSFFQHCRIFLATRILTTSLTFGQAKHGQNGPAATFCQQGTNFTNFTFHEFACPNAIFLSVCCGLNFDATDLPNS